ncbi:hypothetical protein MMC25_003379 [Agyrium rufum]|nr:hypothetical protein [Agyrium rufum]
MASTEPAQAASATTPPPTPHLTQSGKLPKVNGNQTQEQTQSKPGKAEGKKPKQQVNGSKELKITVAEGEKEGSKLSGAELKKRAKAEKAARRAAEKDVKQLPPVAEAPNSQGKAAGQVPQGLKDTPETAAAGAQSQSKTHHKRTGSTSKQLPLRAVHEKSAAPTEAPKEDKKVALFGHLYYQPRRATIAAAGKDVHPAFLALGLQISSYVICGSSARCVAMLLAFRRLIETYITPPGTALARHLTSHLSPQIDFLVSCRPLSVAMGNAIRWLKLQIIKIDPETPESDAKQDLCEAIDTFIRDRITVADQVLADIASEKIQHGDVILTFAKSSVVQQTLLEACRKGIDFRVIVADSRPLFEGKNLARALADIGIEVQYTLAHAVPHVIKDVTKVFLGAHSMMSNGRLYSRVGTALVAMIAQDADVPVIVCCETIKFTEKVALDSIVANEVAPPEELLLQDPTHAGREAGALEHWRNAKGLQLLNLMYDVTPAEYISMVITENGSLPPSSVPIVYRLVTES